MGTNNNYKRGAAFERLIKAYLEDAGWFAIRAAGSHGLVDVLGINTHGYPIFIQCKTGKARMTNKERDSLAALAYKYGGTWVEVTPDNYKELLNG